MSVKEKIKVRLPKGYYYERLKMLKKCRKDSWLLDNYYRHFKTVFWRGIRYAKKNARLTKNSDGSFYKIRINTGGGYNEICIPILEGYALGTFWYEFPDLLMPYVSRREQYFPSFYHEGPYELNHNVCLRKGDIVVDCGANIGLFSAIASAKGCRCYSFEPSEFVINNYLSVTQKYNKDIHIVNAALGDKAGEAHFAYNAEQIESGRISDSGESVKVLTLDGWVKENGIERIDFIKADIEGAEREMLRGARETLSRFAPKLAICTYHLPDDKEVLERIVLEANPNYKIEHKYQKMYAYVPD